MIELVSAGPERDAVRGERRAGETGSDEGNLLIDREDSAVALDLPVGDHALFLWAVFATHALVGYTLGAVLFDEPGWGLVGGVVADVDLLFPLVWEWPLVHRGATHTALAAAVVGLAVGRGDRTAGLAVGTAYASHLAIDATTAAGVPLLYPLSTRHLGVDVEGHSPAATLLLWTGCLAALSLHYRRDAEN